MENNRVAKFLIGTIWGCKVVSLDHKAQERLKMDETTNKLTLYRMDFVADPEFRDLQTNQKIDVRDSFVEKDRELEKQKEELSKKDKELVQKNEENKLQQKEIENLKKQLEAFRRDD
jgi:hypothetical protein